MNCENPDHAQSTYGWCRTHEIEVCPECFMDFHRECGNNVNKIRVEKEGTNKKLGEFKGQTEILLQQEQECSNYLRTIQSDFKKNQERQKSHLEDLISQVEKDLADLKNLIKTEQQENEDKLNQQNINIKNKLDLFNKNLNNEKSEIQRRLDEQKDLTKIKEFVKDKYEEKFDDFHKKSQLILSWFQQSLQQYQPFHTSLKFNNFDLTNFQKIINDIQAAQKTIEKETSDQRLAKINEYYEQKQVNNVQLAQDIAQILPPFPQEFITTQWEIEKGNKNVKLSEEGKLVSKVGKSFQYVCSWLDLQIEEEKVNITFQIIDPGSEEEMFADLFIGLLSTDGWKKNFSECLNGYRDAKVWAINKNGFQYRPIQEQIIFPQNEQEGQQKRQQESDSETVAEGEENKVGMQNEIQGQENANAPKVLKTEMSNNNAEQLKFTKDDVIEIIVDMTNEKNRKAWIQKKGQKGVEFEQLDQKVVPYICMGGTKQEVLFVEAIKTLGRKSKFSLQNDFLSHSSLINPQVEECKTEISRK